MEIIDENTLRLADELKPTVKSGKSSLKVIDDVKMEEMMRDLQNPIKAQKEMAAKVKHFLDQKIQIEMEERGVLSDTTKRWVDSYTSMLEKLQKAIHGDKSVNVNLHAISHGEIAKKIREAY